MDWPRMKNANNVLNNWLLRWMDLTTIHRWRSLLPPARLMSSTRRSYIRVVLTIWKYCIYCGASLAQVCPNCGTLFMQVEGARYCFECGTEWSSIKQA